MASTTSGKGNVHRAMGMRAAALVMMLAMVAGCSSGNTAAPAPATSAPSAVSSVIGQAGGTVTGPDGVQVVIPAGALSADTTIGIARNPAGAPLPLQEGNAPAGPVYEFTPHDLVFNVPVTIRMPVPANGVGAEVFMASLGADWQVNNATLVNGFAEWQRNSFSFGMAGLACAPQAGDLYPCSYPSGGATVTSAAITQIAPGWLNFGSGSAGSWRVNPPGGTVSVTLHYRAAPDCSAVGGGGLSGNVKLIRWNPAILLNTPGRVTTVFDQTVTLAQQPVTPPPGTLSHGGGPTFRGEGSTTVDISSHLGDATNVFGFTFSCQRPGHPVHTGGDLITIIGPMAAPGTTYSIGGTVSNLTGSVVLQNNGGDNQTVTAPNNSFVFTSIAAGSSYNVTVLTQPSGQTCTVPNGTGVNVQANMTGVTVSCSAVSGPVPLAATSIAAGFWNSLAVATDGTVWAWGYLVDPTTGGYKSAAPWATTPVRVQGLTGVRTVALSSESGAFYALHTDGTVSAWGRNDVGQLGDRTTTTRTTPVKVQQGVGLDMDEVCSIAAGSNMLLMARETGCSPGNRSISFGPWIVGPFSGQNFCGDNATGFPFNGAIAKLPSGWPVGQTAGQTASVMTVPDAANVGGAVAITTGRGDGYVWGANGSNRLGAGPSVSFVGGATGPVLGGWSGFVPLEIGRDFAIAVDETGTLNSVGRNAEGQLGDGTTTSRTTMAPVLGLPAFPVTAYSAGQVSAAAIVDGQLWAWGWNDFSGGVAVTRPGRVGTGTGFTQVSVGDMHSLAIGPGGEVYSWGVGTNGGLGRSGSGSLPAVVIRP
ncbi:MAG: hypothetical protein HOP00_12535 [Nitrospira sp.]|nr:hypothetical protein [Nitrospira sp.]